MKICLQFLLFGARSVRAVNYLLSYDHYHIPKFLCSICRGRTIKWLNAENALKIFSIGERTYMNQKLGIVVITSRCCINEVQFMAPGQWLRPQNRGKFDDDWILFQLWKSPLQHGIWKTNSLNIVITSKWCIKVIQLMAPLLGLWSSPKGGRKFDIIKY